MDALRNMLRLVVDNSAKQRAAWSPSRRLPRPERALSSPTRIGPVMGVGKSAR
jgi:hypothetical protein